MNLWERHIRLEFGVEVAPESVVFTVSGVRALAEGRAPSPDAVMPKLSLAKLATREHSPRPASKAPQTSIGHLAGDGIAAARAALALPGLSVAELAETVPAAPEVPVSNIRTVGEKTAESWPVLGLPRAQSNFGLVDVIEHYWPDKKYWYIEFSLEESHDPLVAGTGEVIVYNMSDERLNAIKERAEYLKVYAGHGPLPPPLIFYGYIEDIWTEWQGYDRAVHFVISERSNVHHGVQAYGSWPPPAKASEVLRDLAEMLPIPKAKIKVGREFIYHAGKTFHPQSTVMEAIREVCRDTDSVAYIQRGMLYIVPSCEPVGTVPWVLNARNGLVGRPEPERKSTSIVPTLDGGTALEKPWKRYGKLQVTALLNAAYRPHVRLGIESLDFSGTVMIETVKHVQSRQDYYSIMKVIPESPPQARSVMLGEKIAPTYMD